jgi:hypothetical protein
VLGDIDDDDVWQVTDCLYAFTEDGSITVDTVLNSPTLGATTIRFKHQDALLRLAIPESGFNVAGTYVVDGTAYNVTGLATLWAFLDGNGSDWYIPFIQVGNNLQAMSALEFQKQFKKHYDVVIKSVEIDKKRVRVYVRE